MSHTPASGIANGWQGIFPEKNKTTSEESKSKARAETAQKTIVEIRKREAEFTPLTEKDFEELEGMKLPWMK